MFTFIQYRNFLKEISALDCRSVSVLDYLSGNAGKNLVFKHDVEARSDLALKVAEIEQSLGFRSTFYFHGFFLESQSCRKAMGQISDLGHEIGYHYDVLDNCEGDYDQALLLFNENLEEFAKHGFRIRTICPHGNPTKIRDGWNSNKDFFRRYADELSAYPLTDVVLEFPQVFDGFSYISDAGWKLRKIGNISGNDTSNKAAMDDGVSISENEFLGLVASQQPSLVSLHSHRFQSVYALVLLKKIIHSILRSVYRSASRIKPLKILMSKFYRFTKRF